MSSKFRYIIIIVLLYGCAPGKNLTSTVGEIPEMRTKQILKSILNNMLNSIHYNASLK